MAQLILTDYEIEHDLLLGVCVKCGTPTSEHFVHTMRIIDGWRGALLIYVLFFGLFFFPPFALLVILRWARAVPVRLPTCGKDHAELEWRRRTMLRVLLPIWTVAVLILDAIVAIALWEGGAGNLCLTFFIPLLVVTVVDGAWLNRGAIKLSKPRKGPIRLRAAHPTFVAALAEERARDRVSNPDRRGGHGDVRDDFDDEVT